MKKTRFEAMQEQVAQRLDPEQAPRVVKAMEEAYQDMCKTHENIPESFVSHTRNNIFPVAAAFRALLAEGMSREHAAKLSEDAFLTLMEEPAGAIRKAMKFPGLYHIMPWLFKTMMPKLFKPDAGFDFQFQPARKGEVRFDMTSCPYLKTCQELDCPELAPIFCTTDDICYGHMHEKLIWNRTKTLARGGDLCDFDLYIDQK